MSQIPRPGLKFFLEEVSKLFDRVVIFTTISEQRFRYISELLVIEGSAPPCFSVLEYIDWSGDTKNLNFIANSSVNECILIDDYHGYIHEGQEDNWLKIKCFESPYLTSDTELIKTLNVLILRMNDENALLIEDNHEKF